MPTLNVDLKKYSYPIYIGKHLFAKDTLSSILHKHINGKQVMIVSNTTVAPLYLQTIRESLEGYKVEECVLPDGEKHKTLKTANMVYTALLKAKFDRSATLIALGGGVIGDITGFVASSYQRGINFIGIPTTLLAQVDSSVGGKTGVNHPLGKNMIGAFHQPKAVIIDTHSLTTLAPKEFSAGMAEVIKYGLILSAEFFKYLEQNIEHIMRFSASKGMSGDDSYIEEIIYKSLAIKADVVAKDEFESGIRALLNLGHTFGHAIENSLGYGTYLHGEAVAIGMMMALNLSYLEERLSFSALERTKILLTKANLPIMLSHNMTSKQFMNAMSVDKKALNGEIRLILLQAIGKAYITNDYTTEKLNTVIQKFCNR